MWLKSRISVLLFLHGGNFAAVGTCTLHWKLQFVIESKITLKAVILALDTVQIANVPSIRAYERRVHHTLVRDKRYIIPWSGRYWGPEDECTHATFPCKQGQDWWSLSPTAALAAIFENLSVAAVLSQFRLPYKQAIQVSTRTQKLRGPVSVFVLPGTISLGGPGCHQWEELTSACKPQLNVKEAARWLNVTSSVHKCRFQTNNDSNFLAHSQTIKQHSAIRTRRGLIMMSWTRENNHRCFKMSF